MTTALTIGERDAPGMARRSQAAVDRFYRAYARAHDRSGMHLAQRMLRRGLSRVRMRI